MLKRLTLLFILSLSTLLLLPAELNSQTTPNRAGLVIDFGNGQIQTQCISFDEEQITGYELLQRAGLSAELDVNGGLGAAVCSLNSVGCPGTDCFCQCPGGDTCIYWSYWTHLNGNWQYAVIGASSRTIHHGDIDGWVWGPGSVNNASPPVSTSFDQICPAQAPPTNTPLPPTNTPTLPPPTNTAAPLPTYTSTPSHTPAATAAPEISFTAADYTVQNGSCTQLQWAVQNVLAVFLDDAGVSGQDSTTVCPTQTQTYELRVLHTAGETTESLTIQVVDTPVSPTITPLIPTNTPQPIAQTQTTQQTAANTSTPEPAAAEATEPTATPTTMPPTESDPPTPTAAPTQEMLMIQVPLAASATSPFLPTPAEVAAVPQTVDITTQPTITIPQPISAPSQPFDWLGYGVFTLLVSVLGATLLIIRRKS